MARLDTLVEQLNLLYNDTGPEDDPVIVDRDFISHCQEAGDYLIRIGAVRDDGKTFERTELGLLLIELTGDRLPWLTGFIEGMEMMR